MIGADPDVVALALADKADALRQELEAKVRANLSGAILKSRSGTLVNSINSDLEDDGSTFTASVESEDVPYANILEYGGKTGGGGGSGTGGTTSGTLGGALEPVAWVSQINNIYINGAIQPPSTWTATYPNTLTFGVAPSAGAIITADFTYAFVCRFLDDQNDFE